MMKKMLFALMFLAAGMCSYAQSTNKMWTFGLNCGVDFNPPVPTAFISSSQAYEGVASVSDNAGVLQMYISGDTVYNRMHMPMPNGGNILGTPATIGSCTQGALIVPRPGSSSQYYVFTLQGLTDFLPDCKLFYNLVDMSLDGGLGDVVPSEKLIEMDRDLGEKLTAVKGACNNIWVLVCPKTGSEFRAYEVTAAGVNPVPVITPIIPAAPHVYDIGQIKPSHNGKKVVCTVYGKYEVYDFDNALGTLSHAFDITRSPSDAPYTASFSPDDSKLYVLFDSIYQYDMSLPSPAAILNSKTGISHVLIAGHVTGDMQIADNGRLYIACMNAPFLASIDFPNVTGTGCGFNPMSIILDPSTISQVGLPNMIVNVAQGITATYTHDTTVCVDRWTASSSSGSGTYLWNTGATSRSIDITRSGVYWVTASAGVACGVSDTFRVNFFDYEPSLRDTLVCVRDGVYVPVSISKPLPPSASVLWSTGAATPSVVITDTGTYWVEVRSGQCAVSDTMIVKGRLCDCELLMPNAFSPNGDGMNDFFCPKFLSENCEGDEDYYLQIFNRWGERVYIGNQADRGWNGKYKDGYADAGVYMYSLRVYSNRGSYTRTGDVTLLR